jgi:hypothetical protein
MLFSPYDDGKGFLLHRTPEGDSCAEQIQKLSLLYDVKQKPLENFVTLPEELAASLIWKRVVEIVQAQGPPLTDYELRFYFTSLFVGIIPPVKADVPPCRRAQPPCRFPDDVAPDGALSYWGTSSYKDASPDGLLILARGCG